MGAISQRLICLLFALVSCYQVVSDQPPDEGISLPRIVILGSRTTVITFLWLRPAKLSNVEVFRIASAFSSQDLLTYL